MSIFEALAAPITDLVKTYFPPDLSPEQKAALQAKEQELQLAITNLLAQAGQAQEAELTKRLQADMASDSWLSKNVRPLVLVFLLALYTLFAGFSMYFTISSEYVQMLKEMLTAAFGFYFVSRGIEKVTSTIASASGQEMKKLASILPATADELLRNLVAVADKNFSTLTKAKIHILASRTFTISESTTIVLPISVNGSAFRVMTVGTVDTSSFTGTSAITIILLTKGKEVKNTYFGSQAITGEFTAIVPNGDYQLGISAVLVGTGSVSISLQNLIEVIE